MHRRRLFKALTAVVPAALLPRPAPAAARRPPVLLQEVALAGFDYHAGPALWPRFAAGQPLVLAREPANRFDPRAVAVHWRGQRIGYLPRRHNAVAAGLMDRGQRLTARIEHLRESHNPWARMRLSVWLEIS